MQAHHPADGGVRLRRVCDPGQSEPVSGWLFLFSGCRSQVIICRCCDRGQIYWEYTNCATKGTGNATSRNFHQRTPAAKNMAAPNSGDSSWRARR
jgi:hypothetical protein